MVRLILFINENIPSMKTTINKIRLIFMLFTFCTVVEAQRIRVDENVPFNVTAQHSGIAGDDLVNSYENTMGDYDLEIWGQTYGTTWHITVNKSTGQWNPYLILEVQRDPNDNRVVGGTTYQQIPDSPGSLYFFRTNNTQNVRNPGVNIQYRLSGVTAIIPIGTYTTTVTYTLVDGY